MTVQVTASELLTSTAVNTVGAVTGFDRSAALVMVSDGSCAAEPLHPPSEPSKSKATATISDERINDSPKLDEV
ncbi:MAG TPA: hypothetical protein VF469_13500 [Kofleriaceae bacterium]